MKRGVLLSLVLSGCATASQPTVALVPDGSRGGHAGATGSPVERSQEVVSAADRTAKDRALDEGRHPRELLDFLALAPGMKVADIGAGPGYSSELFVRSVGPTGTVYMQNEPSWLPFLRDDLKERLTHPVMSGGNVIMVERPFGDPLPPEAKGLDLIVMNLIYHDIVNTETDRAQMNRRFFEALKPGGAYVVVDSSAPSGSRTSQTEKFHRIDEAVVREEVAKAGFTLEREGSFLRNPSDTRDWNTSPGAAAKAGRRGTSDRFVLRFKRP